MRKHKSVLNPILIAILLLLSLLMSLAEMVKLAQAAPAIRGEGPRFTLFVDSSSLIPLYTPPTLTVASNVDPDPAVAGGLLTYSISVINEGDVDASHVIITDTLDSYVSFASASDGGLHNTGIVTWNVGVITAGTTLTRTLLVTVGDVVSGTILTNTVVVASSEGSGDSDTIVTTVNTRANLTLTKVDSPDPAITFNALAYTLMVTNSGPSNATGVLLTDTLPVGMVFVTSTPLICVNSNRTVTCNLGAIAAGSKAQVIITVNPTTVGVFTNTATVAATESDPDRTDNSDTENTTINPADLSVIKTASPSPRLVGNPLTYTLFVENDGPNQANEVTLTDTLPAGVIFKSSTGAPCARVGSIVTCNLGNIANGGNRTVTIVVTPTVINLITNTAYVTSNNPDLVPANNSASVATTINRVTDLSITQFDLPDPITAGAILTYTLAVTNNSPSSAAAVVVTDILPAGANFRSSTPLCSQSGGVVTCNLGTIPGDNHVTASIRVLVNPSSRGILTNTVSVDSNEFDPNRINNIATITTTVNQQVDLSITKFGFPNPATASKNLTYTLTVANAGPSVATGVVVTDTLPAQVTFVSAPGCSNVGGIVVCNLNTIANGSSTITSIVVNINSSVEGVITNTAMVTSIEPDLNLANNSIAATTAISQATDSLFKTYLPLITKPNPTELYIDNDTRSDVTFTVIEAGVSCNAPMGDQNFFCGSFPPGMYTVRVNSICGSLIASKIYSSGYQSTRVFCY